jgi:hypothetical protein
MPVKVKRKKKRMKKLLQDAPKSPKEVSILPKRPKRPFLKRSPKRADCHNCWGNANRRLKPVNGLLVSLNRKRPLETAPAAKIVQPKTSIIKAIKKMIISM